MSVPGPQQAAFKWGLTMIYMEQKVQSRTARGSGSRDVFFDQIDSAIRRARYERALVAQQLFGRFFRWLATPAVALATLANSAVARRQAPAADRPAQGSLLRRLTAWHTLQSERRKTIRELSKLPDPMLHDIGMTRSDIHATADRLMWEKAEALARGDRRVVTVVDQLAVELGEIKHAFVEWSHHPTSFRDFAALARHWRGGPAANRNHPGESMSHSAAA